MMALTKYLHPLITICNLVCVIKICDVIVVINFLILHIFFFSYITLSFQVLLKFDAEIAYISYFVEFGLLKSLN